jgi:hypothetical protein
MSSITLNENVSDAADDLRANSKLNLRILRPRPRPDLPAFRRLQVRPGRAELRPGHRPPPGGVDYQARGDGLPPSAARASEL